MSGKKRATDKPAEYGKVVLPFFDNDEFGFRKITVERPLRLAGIGPK